MSCEARLCSGAAWACDDVTRTDFLCDNSTRLPLGHLHDTSIHFSSMRIEHTKEKPVFGITYPHTQDTRQTTRSTPDPAPCSKLSPCRIIANPDPPHPTPPPPTSTPPAHGCRPPPGAHCTSTAPPTPPPHPLSPSHNSHPSLTLTLTQGRTARHRLERCGRRLGVASVDSRRQLLGVGVRPALARKRAAPVRTKYTY